MVGSGSSDNFDRGSMLENIADKIIIPAFQDFDGKLNDLVTAKDSFVANPDQDNLDSLRSKWLISYKLWQQVEMFNIGKAEELQYGFQMNIYPLNVGDVEANISSGTYDLSHPNNHDAIGFPALDYLLFGLASDDAGILDKYNSGADAPKYRKYLGDLINQMKSLTEEVLNDWTNTYRDVFVSSTDNTSTSAVNLMFNDFIFYYEKNLRAQKIGIPAGVFSNDPLPDKVEALFNNKVSRELAIDALDAVQDFFNGVPYAGGTEVESPKSYLTFLEKKDLADLINEKIDEARIELEGLSPSLKEQVNQDNTRMTKAYDALQKVVVLLKVDMLQAFNIRVDYVDADGD